MSANIKAIAPIGFSGTGGGSSLGIEGYNEDFVEIVGEDCELPDPLALSHADHSPPNPFKKPDGSRRNPGTGSDNSTSLH